MAISNSKLRVRFFVALLLCLSACYVWMVATIFEPISVGINVEYLRQLNYVINSKSCSPDEDVYVLVLVGSHPDHSAIRDVIRHTWGNPNIPKYRFKLVFLFGLLPKKEQNDALVAESLLNGDIVQGDFQDSYYNVTLRDLMGFQWAWQFCKNARYILRADDDIALDIYKLLNIVEKRFAKESMDSIGCYEIVEKAEPRRYGRYAISPEDFNARFYANYCMGWMYIMTPAVANKLLEMAYQVKPIWINDVYITGMLANAVKLRLMNLNLKYTLEYTDMLQFFQNKSNVTYDLGPTRSDVVLTSSFQEIYRNKALMNDLIVAVEPR